MGAPKPIMRTTGTANGTTLSDRYRLERELGRRGMATVYLAHDLRHHRHVAIKVLHPDLAARIGVDRFLREIQTTARLQHPHILRLIDSGAVDGAPFYVMPFVTEVSLRHRLDSERQIPIATRSGSPARSRRRSITRIATAPSTATSSPPTSSCTTGMPSSPIPGSRWPCPTTARRA